MESSPFSSPPPLEPDDETQRLIGEVAKRHGIVLGSGDPLCVVLTVLELFLDRYLSRLDGMFQAHQAVSFEALDRSSEAAKAIAEQLITSAANYHVKTTRAAAEELAAALAKAAAAELVRVEKLARDARRLVWIGALVWVAILSVALGVVIGGWLAPPWRQSFLIHNLKPDGPYPTLFKAAGDGHLSKHTEADVDTYTAGCARSNVL
ncbi:MAG: hypothetical protein WAN43_17975 [Rhodomicrobium sp.]